MNSIFAVNKAPPTVTKQARIEEKVVRIKTLPEISQAIGCGLELVGGFLAVFYLLGALGLGGALLFFTFLR